MTWFGGVSSGGGGGSVVAPTWYSIVPKSAGSLPSQCCSKLTANCFMTPPSYTASSTVKVPVRVLQARCIPLMLMLGVEVELDG